MRFTESQGHKVVSTSTAETVGRIDSFLVDAPAGRVVGLLLKKTSGNQDTLPWESIAAFGTDAVTVTDDGAITTATGRLKELQAKKYSIQGKRVLTQAGVEVGAVKDVEFDPQEGTVRALLTDREEVPGDRLVDIGSYAVIVAVPEPPQET
jgi:uncharacterized protein YrrD